jgi:hypothetical protein
LIPATFFCQKKDRKEKIEKCAKKRAEQLRRFITSGWKVIREYKGQISGDDEPACKKKIECRGKQMSLF